MPGGIRNELCFVSANLEVVRLAAAAGAGVLCRTKLAEGPGLVPVGDRPPPASPADDLVMSSRTSRSAGSFAKSVTSRLKTDLAIALESVRALMSPNIGRGRIPMSGTCGDCRPTLMVGAARRVPTTLPCPFWLRADRDGGAA